MHTQALSWTLIAGAFGVLGGLLVGGASHAPPQHASLDALAKNGAPSARRSVQKLKQNIADVKEATHRIMAQPQDRAAIDKYLKLGDEVVAMYDRWTKNGVVRPQDARRLEKAANDRLDRLLRVFYDEQLTPEAISDTRTRTKYRAAIMSIHRDLTHLCNHMLNKHQQMFAGLEKGDHSQTGVEMSDLRVKPEADKLPSVYFVRHAYSIANAAYLWQKDKRLLDSALAPQGIARSTCMNKELLSVKNKNDGETKYTRENTLVFSSVLLRAINTAAIMFEHISDKVIVAPYLKEDERGPGNKVSSQNIKELKKQFQAQWKEQNPGDRNQADYVDEDFVPTITIDWDKVRDKNDIEKLSDEATKSNLEKFQEWLQAWWQENKNNEIKYIFVVTHSALLKAQLPKLCEDKESTKCTKCGKQGSVEKPIYLAKKKPDNNEMLEAVNFLDVCIRCKCLLGTEFDTCREEKKN